MESENKSLEDLLNELREKTRKRIEVSPVEKVKPSFAFQKPLLSKSPPPSTDKATKKGITPFEKALFKLEKESRRGSFGRGNFFLSFKKFGGLRGIFKKAFFFFLSLLLGASLILFFSKSNSPVFINDLATRASHLKKWFPDFLQGYFLDFFSLDNRNNVAATNNEVISINRLHTVKTYIPIISSPQLLTPNRLFFANRSGYVFLINPISGELIDRYVLSEHPKEEKIDIVSSPLHLQLNDNTHSVLYLHANGEFTALSSQASYLYRSEKGIFNKQTIYTSPVLFFDKDSKSAFVVATMQGGVSAFHSERGNVMWQTKIENESFFATPLVDKSELLLVGLSGELYKIDLNSGNLIWHKTSSLGSSVKASPLMLKTPNDAVYYLILSSSGKLGIYSQGGNELFAKSIDEPMVASASPVAVAFPHKKNQANQAIVATLSGNVYKVTVENNFDDENLKAKVDLLWGRKELSFVSRPIAFPHIDATQKNAFFLLLADRNGTLLVIDSQGNERAVKSLNYHVSATPVVADINGDANLEIIVAGENGDVEIFRLATTKPLRALQNRSFSSGFLDFRR